MQSTQVFANRALDRAVTADGLRTGCYNPNPTDGRIPGHTNTILEEFSKRPSSETANPTQKKQMAQAIMRTATIHSPGNDAAYQEVDATQRDIDHFTCMRIIRNVSNYLIGNMITNQYSDWGDFGTVQVTVSSLVDSNISKNLTELQRLAGITPENFTDWFVEAVCSLKDGLKKSAAWHWRDQEERDAPASASSAGAGGGLKQAGAGGGSLGASEGGEGVFGEGPQPKAAAVAPTTIRDLVGNDLSLDKEKGVYAAFVFVKLIGEGVGEIKDTITQYIKSVNAQLPHPADLSKPAYINDLYAKLLAIYDAEQAAPVADVPVRAQPLNPVPQKAAALHPPRPGAGGRWITMDDFTYTGEIGKIFSNIVEAHGIPDLTIMGVYDPAARNIHSQYGQLTEIGMRLAFIDWEASQLNKPKNGYLGADAGFYVFRIETGNTLASGEKELVSTTDLPPEQKQHMTAETFYQNAEHAFAKGFNSYAGVVRSSSLRSGHFFTLFVRKEADGAWEVFAINPLGKPESLLSVTAEVLDPFVTHLTSKGIRIKTQQALVTGFQMRNETCGIWATLIARTLCDVGSIKGLNKFYDLLVSTDASMQNLANINRAVAQDIGLADVVKYRTLRLLAEEKSGIEATLQYYGVDGQREARRQIAALTSSINAVEQELANKFGHDYETILASQKGMVEQKLIKMEENFAKYYAELLEKVVSFSQANPIDFGDFRNKTEQKIAEEDARVAPGIRAFHNRFVQHLADQKAAQRR